MTRRIALSGSRKPRHRNSLLEAALSWSTGLSSPGCCVNPIMTTHTKRILKTVLRADGAIAPDLVDRVIGILQGEGQEPTKGERPALLTQAQKACQLGISRFSIRKMVQGGRLH